MSSEDLPSNFDVVLLGTGVTESIVAAACARVGKTVLHLDRNSFYGSQSSTFSFTALNEYFAKVSSNETGNNENKESDFQIAEHDNTISNVVIKSYLPETLIDDVVFDEKNAGSSQKDGSKKEKVVTSELGLINTECDDFSTESTDVNKKDQEKDEQVEELVKNKKEIETDIADNEQVLHKVEETRTVIKGIEKVVDENDSSEVSTEIKVPFVKSCNSNYKNSLAIQAKLKNPKENKISIEDFNILNRKFNIDLSPNFLFCAGKLVKGIIKANISHYAEFKLVDRILMWRDNNIEEVPCNRSDVFSSTFLTMIEKRTLMKFLNFCLSDTDEEINENETFQSFLTSKRLSENLQHFIIYSIAMVKPHTKTKEALNATRSFLSSIGHYGKTPFLWPLYGCGEIPQMFCRMSAVFAGLYCLDKIPKYIKISDNEEGLLVNIDNKDIKCKNFVMDNSYLCDKYIDHENSVTLSKAILITSKSLAPSSEEHLSFLTIPPLEGKSEPVRVIEVGPASAACPSGLFILYLTTASEVNAYEDLKSYVELLVHEYDDSIVDETKPLLYWSVYYNHGCYSPTEEIPKNIHVGMSLNQSLGFSNSVTAAEEIFSVICPVAEFLEKVPNAEDIIWDHDENQEPTEKNENIIEDEQENVNDGKPSENNEKPGDNLEQSENNKEKKNGIVGE